MAIYPNAIPTIAQVFQYADGVHWMNAAKWNIMRDELIAGLTELGSLPKGTFATVKARLDDIYPQFHDRGDPASNDYAVGDLTTNGAWHDMDLSGIVPVGAKAVLLNANVQDGDIGIFIRFREKGNTNPINVSYVTTQVAGVTNRSIAVVGCDTDRKIQYFATNTTWTMINIAVRGWWK